MAETAEPIIIIKKKGGHGGHHGGAWKVAYADFVTAMMALFIVLWLMNASKQVQEAVGGYFKDPRGTAKVVGTNTVAAVQSGLYYGYIGLVDGILERILKETQGPDSPAPKIIATGGLAHLIIDDSRFIQTVDDMLTLDGLRLIYERNRVAKIKHSHSEAAGKHA